MLCNNFNIEGDLQHTEYIASWLKALEDDEKLILKASAKAQKAFDYLLQTNKVIESKLQEETA
jgi:antirestriction protein ArdC